MINVDKIIVLHYEPLVNRKTLLKAFLKQYNIEATWITKEPSKTDLKRFYKYSSDNWNKKTRPEEIGEFGTLPPRKLGKSELSLLYKHYIALKRIVREKYETTLLLEDDVLFTEDFVNIFNSHLKNTPADWDYIFPGSGCQLRVPKALLEKDKIAYLKSHPATKCTDSMIIKLNAAKKMLSTFNEWDLPADWEFNYQLKEHDMKVYWWEPPVIAQGSQTGIYKSAIQ
jgi:GR25 family glycosyltransferase involved in LPS biosynthesis